VEDISRLEVEAFITSVAQERQDKGEVEPDGAGRKSCIVVSSLSPAARRLV
jgi:hypothetical protein